jgi:hypothetical protein
MTRHTYPGTAMLGDYLRAAAGFVPIAAILATTRVGLTVAAVLAGIAALFLLFGIRTALRHGTQLELTDGAIGASGPFGARIAWPEMDGMKLAYYSTRRDRGGGWLQLELRAARAVLRLDSRINGFAVVLDHAAWAAAARGLPLDAATRANLQALGVGALAAEPAPRQARGGPA